MTVSQDFLDYVADQLDAFGEVDIKKMFGGAGVYRDGAMFALVADDTLYLKAGESNRWDFEAKGLRPFQPYPKKTPKMTMPYYAAPADVLETPPKLAEWARKAYATAVAKKKKKKKR